MPKTKAQLLLEFTELQTTNKQLLAANTSQLTLITELETKVSKLKEANSRLTQRIQAGSYTNGPAITVTPANKTKGAPAPKQNKNTDGVQSIKEPERVPTHKPDEPDPDTVAPSYNQLYKVANLLATFNYHPDQSLGIDPKHYGSVHNASSRHHADVFIKAFNKHLNKFTEGNKPYRVYLNPETSDPLYDQPWRDAKNDLLIKLLDASLIKYNVTKPEPKVTHNFETK